MRQGQTQVTEGPAGIRTMVLDIPVAAVTRAMLTARFEQLLAERKRGWISYVNIHAVNLAQELPWFKTFLQNALLTYCDGAGVKLGAALLGTHIPERIVFSDWIYDVCAAAARAGKSIFLLGGREEVLAAAADALRARLPDLIIAGIQHGYFHNREMNAVVQNINKSHAAILIVGMGMPKQEAWILSQYQRMSVGLILNAGSCFDYVAGTKRRCPDWMGRFGFEWFYRLLQEPRRLWKRYLIGNPLFLLRVIRQRFASSR